MFDRDLSKVFRVQHVSKVVLVLRFSIEILWHASYSLVEFQAENDFGQIHVSGIFIEQNISDCAQKSSVIRCFIILRDETSDTSFTCSSFDFTDRYSRISLPVLASKFMHPLLAY